METTCCNNIVRNKDIIDSFSCVQIPIELGAIKLICVCETGNIGCNRNDVAALRLVQSFRSCSWNSTFPRRQLETQR